MDLDLDLDPNEKIFDDAEARRELHRQMSQLSPRRSSDASNATTTLPFYEDISPSVALERLFEWFHKPAARGNSVTDGEDEKISREEFNQLRKCVGKQPVTKREWKRALEELGAAETEEFVARRDFKALFGPPPFFGSPTVQGIVREVMKTEEFVHFAQILVSRFGVESADSSSRFSGSEKGVGLEQVQDMQRTCCADTVFEQAEWIELCKKLLLPETTQHFTWMQFAEALSVNVKNKRICSPHADPAAIVYAVLANDKVLATIKDADDDQVSQKAFTNLFRVQREKVDDEVWLNLLQNMQTTYNYRQERRGRKNSFTEAEAKDDADGHGHEQPLVIVRNTRNQVLSYEIVFDEHGDIGLDLQSDFFGQCSTVAEIRGQAARHPIIQKHDIVAAVNGVNLTNETMAANKDEEQQRVTFAKGLLNANDYNADEKTLHLCLKTIEQIPSDGKFQIQIPSGSSWKPSSSDGGSSLKVEFEIPKHRDFEQAVVSWNEASQSIDIDLDGETGIAKSSTVVIKVSGIDCGGEVVLGPCELTDGEVQILEGESLSACSVILYSNWNYREGTLGNPLRDRVRRADDEYFDSSLKPISRDFRAGESGLTLGSDFFGQCAVVTAVKRMSTAEEQEVDEHDIFASITSLGGNDGKTFNQLNCIKPFALSKRHAEAHINEVRKQLMACQKSGRPYRLEFLRLNSFFFHENARTIFTFHPLVSLRDNTSLVIKMPNTKWHVSGPLSASILDPSGIKVREVVWDSQQHSVHLKLDNSSIPEPNSVVVEIHGIAPPSKEKTWTLVGAGKAPNCAGPSEVVGVYAGDAGSAPEMEFVLHEHWHSFIVGHQGIEALKVNETLKKFKTSPASLWEVLEYTSLLFEMCKSKDSENMSFSDLNKLIGLVCGDGKTMSLSEWNTLCRNLGAKPLVGLTRRQFACCWNEVTGLSNHNAKEIFVRIETARKLYAETIQIFQEDEDEDVITKETIAKLAKIGGFSAKMMKKALDTLDEENRPGWDCDLFSQIVCGANRGFRFEDNASSLWIKIHFAKKLFSDFSAKNKMKKKNFVDLLAAAKVTKPKLTSDLWSEIYDSVGLDETSGFSLGELLEVYSGNLLGSRHPLADYYRIETFKLLPERRAKNQEASKEAALNVAPEKINVKDIAAKALDDIASTDEVFQELLDQGLQFSKLEAVEERDATKEFAFESELAGKRRSRSKGFLHLQIGSISELADRLVNTNSQFNKDGKEPEELYAMFEITDAEGLQDRIPKPPKKNPCKKIKENLFGSKDADTDCYVVERDEMWDSGATQLLMREMHETEKLLKTFPPHTPDYDATFAKLSVLMKRLTPTGPEVAGDDAFDGRIFSSVVLRDPSPDAIVRFPDDQFRLYVNMDDGSPQKLLVCKLFKCIGSEKSRLQLELGYAIDAQKKAETTYTILRDLVEQQKQHLRHAVAINHTTGKDAADDSRVWTALSKLRQKRQDLLEFEEELGKRNQDLLEAQQKLNAALRLEEEVEQNRGDQNQEAPTDATVPGVDSLKPAKPGEDAIAPEPMKVKLIGLAFFDVEELLHVLHDDKEFADDVATFTTEKLKDVGVLLLKFEYKCGLLQQETPCAPLPGITIAMSSNDETSVVEKIREEHAFEYPSHSHLELQWKTNGLKIGDRLCLVREEDNFKLSMPYFLVLWKAVDDGNKKSTKGGEDENADNERCEWWIPEILKKMYSVPGEKLVNTDPSRAHGCLQLPSSIGLSLPPGTYKVYLIRNESDGSGNNFRTVLGKTASLAVLPGVNSVHTSFGTTPLIDVKPLFASLQVFAEDDRSVVADALTNQDGFHDPDYFARIELEQEIEVTRREIKASEATYEKVKHKKDGKVVEQKIAQHKAILEELLEQMKRLQEKEAPALQNATSAPGVASQSAGSGAQRTQAHTVFSSQQEVVLSYRFNGGAPSAQDRIVFLPADVVRVSDNLRSTILGKLQGNNSQQVDVIRETMERELVEVQQFFELKFSFRGIRNIFNRKVKPLFGCGGRTGPESKSDAFKAITGTSDGSFVWDECMSAFSSAPPIAKKNFSFIIRDLLDEIGARKTQLGLKNVAAGGEKSKLSKLNAFMKLEMEVPVPVASAEEDTHDKSSSKNAVIGECKTSLGNRFRQGGFYVAKYVRRAGEEGSDKNIMSCVGEICRFGPFYIEPARFSCSPSQMYFYITKLFVKYVMSDEGILVLKIVGNALVSFIKYFLAVVSLSFNISVLAGNFNIGKFDHTRIDAILESFKARLSSFYGPIEVALHEIYTFFNGYIAKLIERMNILDIAGECVSGFFLYYVLMLLFAATFVVYVVVQEDLLLKIQKIHTYLPINPGKSLLAFLEQVGALLVIPLYLTIKSCVLFISGQWEYFYMHLQGKKGLAEFNLHSTYSYNECDAEFAKINYGFGIAGLILIVAFLFVCLPLLLLDLYSWVPLSELEERQKLMDLAHSFDRTDIKAAVHSNANLTECGPRKCPAWCARIWKFQTYYNDYMTLKFRQLVKKYGILGLLCMFIYIYMNLMLQSMGRSLGVLIGWRRSGPYMYKNALYQPNSRWKCYDRFCLRFNFAWKIQYIKDKIVMPFVNVVLVTLGLWGESQWKEYNVEERANNCYIMEPSGEIKQLQMMSLHGKITSLFWLCIPKTMVLAYLAEVLNRGPVFSYFLNKQFLQADIPESERERDPVWRYLSIFSFAGEEDVVYLSDTRFYSTVLKWGSSLVEIITLLMVYPNGHQNRAFLFGVALISATVSPLLEFNEQVIKAYVDYKETVENFASSNECFSKVKKGSDMLMEAKDTLDNAPKVAVNLRAGKNNAGGNPPTAASGSPPPASGAPVVGSATENSNSAASAGSDVAGTALANANPPTAGAAAAVSVPGSSTLPTTPGARVTGSPPAPTAKPVSAPATNTAISSVAAATPVVVHFGGDDEWGVGDELDDLVNDTEDLVEDELENLVGNDGTAALLVAAGVGKSKKQLILLNAMPEISYVVLTDALDAGEGEITVNWQINARQRFHALDAIGMFPAREAGDFRIRTMEDCICYRLLKHRGAEPFGWKPDNRSNEDFEHEVIVRQAKSLRDLTERDIKEITNPIYTVDGERSEEKATEHDGMLKLADIKMDTMMNSPKLKPYKKKMSDMLEEEVQENKLHAVSRRATRMLSNNGALSIEEAAKKARKVVSDQVQFRPANSNTESDEDPGFENFVYGNNAGIYQSKYGLQKYEFCYLRHADVEAKVVGLNGDKAKANSGPKVTPMGEQSKNYEILDRFCSNAISIGTFNIFMNLTCDIPMVGANETVNLSWIIYGVPYSILSNSKSRNCVGFYKVEGSGGCSKIEIIPTSAYLEVDDNEPCPGRMLATAPKEPRVYEIRFLFNFFKEAKLHRQCQVFGDLENQMQHLRIRSFYEKRSLTDEIRKFAVQEPRSWGIARMNTLAWLKSMLLSTLREPVKDSVMESTSEYSAFLYGRLKSKLTKGMESNSKVYQRRIRKMIAPLYLNGFMTVLQVALASNSQMNDQLASVIFMSPTDDDLRKKGLDPSWDSLLLPSDKKLMVYGPAGFRLLAKNYLNQQSLCGYHDFVDDIVLNQTQLLQSVDQMMKNLSSSCVALYESAIGKAVKEMMDETKRLGKENAMQGIDAILIDLCRNHIQSIVRAFVETDCRTGMRWKGPPKGTQERLAALRRGSIQADIAIPVDHFAPTIQGGCAPVTRQHIAVRRWVRPRLERKIVVILRQRHARLLSGNFAILMQIVPSCCGQSLSLVGSPFPAYRSENTPSALYFLEENKNTGQKSSILNQPRDEKQDEVREEEPAEDDEEETNQDAEENAGGNDDDDGDEDQGEDDPMDENPNEIDGDS